MGVCSGPEERSVSGSAERLEAEMDGLSRHDDPLARQTAAWDMHTAPEALGRLAQDDCVHVRLAAAENPNTPPEALGRLAQDEHREVSAAARSHPACPSADPGEDCQHDDGDGWLPAGAGWEAAATAAAAAAAHFLS